METLNRAKKSKVIYIFVIKEFAEVEAFICISGYCVATLKMHFNFMAKLVGQVCLGIDFIHYGSKLCKFTPQVAGAMQNSPKVWCFAR